MNTDEVQQQSFSSAKRLYFLTAVRVSQHLCVTLTTPLRCIVMQLSGCLPNCSRARIADRCTIMSCDPRYSTILSTAPSWENRFALFPHLLHIAIASAKCRLKMMSVCKQNKQFPLKLVSVCRLSSYPNHLGNYIAT